MPITLVTGKSLPFIAHLYSSTWPAPSSFKRLLGPLLNRPKLTWAINGGQGPVTLELPAQLVAAGGPVPVNGDFITLTEDGGAGDVLATLIVEDLPDNLDVTVDHRIVGTPLIAELGMTPFSATYSGIDIAVQARAAVAATAHLTWDTTSIPLTGITGTIAHAQTSLVALEDLRKIGGANCQFHVDQNGKVYFGIVSLASATYSVKLGTDVTVRRYSSPATNRLNVVPVQGGVPAGATAPITATYDNSAGSPLGKRVLNPPLTYPNITDQTTLTAIANYYGAALDHDHAAIELILPGFGTLFSLAAAGGATVRYWEPAVWETLQSEVGSGTYSPNYVLQSVELDGPSQKILLSDIASALDELAFEVDRMLMRMAVAQPQSVQLGQVGVIPPGMLGGGTGGGPATPNTPAGLALATSIENIAQVNNAQITASWTANAVNENVVSYEVGIRKGGTTDFAVTRAIGSPVKFAGLIQGQSYDVRIRSINNLGLASAWSSVVTLTSGADVTAPAVPTGLAAIKTPRGALISWAGNTEADLQGYRLKVSIAGGAYSVVFDKQLATSFAYVAPAGTALATSLTFEVAAVDWSGNYSADSAASGAVTTDGIVFDELLAGNMKVFGLLTTGGLRTATSGARIALDSISIRTYDATANNYGAPSGAGVTTELKNDGSAFFSGTIKSSGVSSGWFLGDTAATLVPTLPGLPATGFLLDPVNGLRFWSAGVLTAQFQGSGVTILAGTIAGPTIYSPNSSVGVAVGSTGLKISGAAIDIFANAAGQGLNFRTWDGISAWIIFSQLYGSTTYGSAWDFGYGTAGTNSGAVLMGSGGEFAFVNDQGGFGGQRALHQFRQRSAVDATGTTTTYAALDFVTGAFGANSADLFASDQDSGHAGSHISRRCGARWYNYSAINVNPAGSDISFPQRYSNAPTAITLTTVGTDATNGGTKTIIDIDQFGFHFYVGGQTAAVAGGKTENKWTASGGS